MKSWWTEKAWPWLKETGWKILVPLITLLGIIGAVLAKLRPRVTVVDPTEAADERAKIEEETRQRQLEEERKRREAELAAVRAEAGKERTEFEAGQAADAERLRQNPDELKDRMLRARRGR